MANQISNMIKTTRVNNAAAAGTTDINTSSVDMAGYEGVRFTVLFGAIVAGAVTSVKAAQSADDSTFNDLEGSAITVADDDDNQAFIIDVWRPVDRYVRVTIDRGTQNATVDGVIAEQYGPRVLAPTNDATTVGGQEVHTSPAEGTA